eukprot:TRINITY_DN5564_c0_g1_i2.p1 TRINITY_DN5564_c0_g1~~TRINITY_DN5564_c0_g1_i2.p1  ORF type:complete len:192 (-),score=4.85 TRINITY_DN5564_c0_g1_i2:30-605(-)
MAFDSTYYLCVILSSIVVLFIILSVLQRVPISSSSTHPIQLLNMHGWYSVLWYTSCIMLWPLWVMIYRKLLKPIRLVFQGVNGDLQSKIVDLAKKYAKIDQDDRSCMTIVFISLPERRGTVPSSLRNSVRTQYDERVVFVLLRASSSASASSSEIPPVIADMHTAWCEMVYQHISNNILNPTIIESIIRFL